MDVYNALCLEIQGDQFMNEVNEHQFYRHMIIFKWATRVHVVYWATGLVLEENHIRHD